MSPEQHGFRKILTTDNATYTLTNEILTAMNNKPQVGSIFCTAEKEFDCVDHNILLLKIEFCGIIGKKTLYTQYLTEKYQQVLLNNTKSHNFITSK